MRSSHDIEPLLPVTKGAVPEVQNSFNPAVSIILGTLLSLTVTILSRA